MFPDSDSVDMDGVLLKAVEDGIELYNKALWRINVAAYDAKAGAMTVLNVNGEDNEDIHYDDIDEIGSSIIRYRLRTILYYTP